MYWSCEGVGVQVARLRLGAVHCTGADTGLWLAESAGARLHAYHINAFLYGRERKTLGNSTELFEHPYCPFSVRCIVRRPSPLSLLPRECPTSAIAMPVVSRVVVVVGVGWRRGSFILSVPRPLALPLFNRTSLLRVLPSTARSRPS